MGWVFLILWIVVGLLLFSGNKNAKRQGHVNRYSPVVILGGSFIVALIIMGIYGSFFEPPKASSPSTPQENAAKQEISTTLQVWDTSLSKDKMTGERSAYASSPITGSTERMAFPYSDTKAWLGVGCDGTNEWVYVGFTTAPNLNKTDTEDGYNLIRTRIKWDDKVEYITLTQDWGSKFIHFRDDKSIISNMAKSNSVLLELNWHGEGKTYFKFSLSGSSAALKKIRSECAK